MAEVTLAVLDRMKREGRRFAVLTAYDATFAAMMGEAGVAVILVGDSLGMVVQGRRSTAPVTMDDMVYHTECVARGVQDSDDRPLIMADMPFGTTFSPLEAAGHAARLMQAGANIVKIEGGAVMEETVRFLTAHGIPVCAHLGLTPQTTDMLGGYRVQGRGEDAGRKIVEDALALEAAGARMLLFECVPNAVGQAVAEAAKAPVIGIGAGPSVDAQVLVLQDMLDLTRGRKARFVKNYLEGRGDVQAAFRAFVEEVETGAYPAPEHCYG